MPEQETVLIAGGAGFIGSHLSERFVNNKQWVVCVDNFATGSKANVAKLLQSEFFELIRHDIMMPLFVEVEKVYNLASPASPVAYQKDPVATVKTNVMGTINQLGLCKRTGATMVQASTSEIYGDPDVHPQPETYFGNVNPIGPRACYDEGKRCAETLCAEYHRQHKVDVRVARLFNTYGPFMAHDDGRVITNFILQALRGEDLTIYGKGTQTRSFCYVDDTVEGLLRLGDVPVDTFQSADLPVVNLGNPHEVEIGALAELVIKQTGSNSKIKSLPALADDPRRRKPDISRAKKWLDWTPKVPLEDGLAQTIDFYRRSIAA
jgi:UDP-glucuronate decarboxylase